MKRWAILTFLFSLILFVPLQAKILGDFNNDGKLTIADAIGFVRIQMGLDPQGDVGQEYILASECQESPSEVEILMISIPAGSFQIGQVGIAEPVHNVTLDAFLMSQTEITQAQYLSVIGTNPSIFPGIDDRPVENITWYQAVIFCNKLSEANGFESCYDLITWECNFKKNGFRLPTEAEWEYACRAGTSTTWYNGDDENNLGDVAWYKINSGGTTHPVGLKKPNEFGLYDMYGNIDEYCNDWWADTYTDLSVNNPTGPDSGYFIVGRGGYYNSEASSCRSASRWSSYIDSGNSAIGFRVVRRP